MVHFSIINKLVAIGLDTEMRGGITSLYPFKGSVDGDFDRVRGAL